MKTRIIRFAAVSLALVLVLSLQPLAATKGRRARGETQAPAYGDAGYYVLSGMEEEGAYFDAAMLQNFGMTGGLVLEDGGTGFLFLAGEVNELEWENGILRAEGEELPYQLIDGMLTIAQEDFSMIFTASEEEPPTRELAAQGTAPADPEPPLPAADPGDEDRRVVVVTGTADLVDSIADNTTILLAPGVYNLSEYFAEGGASLESFPADAESFSGYGAYRRDTYDGAELVICDVDDLEILAADPEDPAEIVIDASSADVMKFIDCDGLVLEGLVMGHVKENRGECSGDVIELQNCYGARLHYLDLYGCGVYGVKMQDCTNVTLDSCLIYECSDGLISAERSGGVTAKYCEFRDTDAYSLIWNVDSRITFLSCTFEGLKGSLIGVFAENRNPMNRFVLCSFDERSGFLLEDAQTAPELKPYLEVVTMDSVPKG